MPYLSIETNRTVEEASTQAIMKKASSLIAGLLGKPESYVMISIKPETPLSFAGTDAPAAFIRLKSIGLSKDRCVEFSEKICDFIDQELGVPNNRVFIEFKDLERNLFGWNGKTF
jgi:phenylpyruvate tautomerase PptA (4-oxalocrotonate tautomerase family)